MTFVITSCDQTPSDTSSDSGSSTSSDPVFIYEDYYNDYYDSIESWEDGNDLREQLRALVNLNVNLVDFNNSSNIWAVNQLADETLDNYDRVEVVYGNYQPLKTFTSSGANGGWQREHAFAQSLGDFDVASTGRTANESLILRSDFHNLFASDGSLNGSRNNLNLGNVSDDMGAITNPK
ncbi:MAG TPA: endonuclease, partial [Bacilli bacterium]|nr:endonuclease [Bacilli bacterium]